MRWSNDFGDEKSTLSNLVLKAVSYYFRDMIFLNILHTMNSILLFYQIVMPWNICGSSTYVCTYLCTLCTLNIIVL